MKAGATTIAAALLAVIAIGCGGGGMDGASIEIGLSAAPDSFDPAMAVTAPAVDSLWLVYTPLLTYRHAEGRAGTKLIPGLATSLPHISKDGLTYRLRLRPGLRYSDGKPVRASDFEHTVKRVLILNSPGAPFFAGIVGAQEFSAAKDPGADLEGIDTDDETGEIAIHLVAPDGTFSNVLATDFAGVVPGDTPYKVAGEDPPAGVGSYEIADAGRNHFALLRNDEFDLPGIPQAKIDKISVSVSSNPEAQTEDVIHGDLDFMQEPPPPDLLGKVKEEQADHFREYPVAGTTYFFLNQRLAPFDSEAVRRAVNIAISREAIERIYGGRLEPSCTYLPPQLPGSAPVDPCPYGDPERAGDLEEARGLVTGAGGRGTEVSVWGPNEGPARDATIYVAGVFDRIGLDAKPKLVSPSAFIQLIGNQSTGAQAGIVEFIQDFPHPADFFGAFSGDSIQPVGNFNFGNVDDPWLTRQIAELRTRSDLDAVEGRWAALDRRLAEDADLLIVGHGRRSVFLSDRMDFDNCAVVTPIYETDYSQLCLR